MLTTIKTASFRLFPVSESEEGFEVTMTATTDDDLCQERVAQIQVLVVQPGRMISPSSVLMLRVCVCGCV